MKKSFYLLCAIVLVVSALLLRGLFLTVVNEFKKEPENTVESPQNKPEKEQEDEKQETAPVSDKEDDKKEETPQNTLTIDLKEDGPKNAVSERQLYRMLDFDRRLILKVGQQDKYLCSIFCLAYARGILDNNLSSDPYDYYDGDGAVWRWAEFEDIALDSSLDKVLQKAYDELRAGRPVILFVSGKYAHIPDHEEYSRSTGDHYVLLIGYREDADYKKLKASDFYAADPTRGYSDSKETFMPWVVLTDEAPALVNGQYALYAPEDRTAHVSTCVAYADSCTWDSDLKEAIQPEYWEHLSE